MAVLAFHADAAAVRLGQVLAQIQPEADALDAPMLLRTDPMEPLEHLAELLLRDSDALIRDGDPDLVAVAGNPKRDGAALRRVFDRVAQEVAHDLLDALLVGVDH